MRPNESQIIEYWILKSAKLHFTVFPQKQNIFAGAAYDLSATTQGAARKTVTAL
jgi:hypothetical protein